MMIRLIAAGAGTQARQADGELRLPTDPEETIEMVSECEGFSSPGCQAEQCTDTNPAEAPRIGPFRAGKPPVVVTFRSGSMQAGVNLAIISLLIDDEPFRP